MWTRIQSSCEKSYSQRSAESLGFSPGTPVPPTGKSEYPPTGIYSHRTILGNTGPQ